MPTSAAGNNRTAGFTLVELMIVIALVALASAAVVLALPDPRGRLRDDAERFAARVRAAHDLAVVEGRSVSVWVSDGGYGFDRREAGAWVQGQGRRLARGPVLGPHQEEEVACSAYQFAVSVFIPFLLFRKHYEQNETPP